MELGIVSPLKATIGLLFLFYVANCAFGLKAGLKKGEHFSLKKFKQSIMLLITYFILIILINQSMVTYGELEYALFLVKVITWFFCWSYFINIVRNMNVLCPKVESLKVLYHLLTVDIKHFIINKWKKKLGIEKEEEDGKCE